MPLVIVGNKSDLKPEQRQVPMSEGTTLAEEFRCSFTEASARLNSNVTRAFEMMISEVEKPPDAKDPQGGSKCNLM